MSLAATIKASISATLTRDLDLASGSSPLQKVFAQVFSDGVGAGQANLIWHDQRTLTASSNENIDLSGTLTDIYGQAVNFARIKAIMIVAQAANTNDVNVTRPASNGAPLFLAAGDGIALKPGAMFLWTDPGATGVAITGGTGDLLNIANSAGSTSVTYDIVVIGAAS